jgi:hypothetical protein
MALLDVSEEEEGKNIEPGHIELNKDQMKKESDAVDNDKILGEENEVVPFSSSSPSPDASSTPISIEQSPLSPTTSTGEGLIPSPQQQQGYSPSSSTSLDYPPTNTSFSAPLNRLYIGTTPQSLESLNISNNGCGPLACSALYHLLVAPSIRLRTLVMSANGVGVGAKSLATAIARNNTLETVDLSNCKIEDLGGLRGV